jgi:hypothetical protein
MWEPSMETSHMLCWSVINVSNMWEVSMEGSHINMKHFRMKYQLWNYMDFF